MLPSVRTRYAINQFYASIILQQSTFALTLSFSQQLAKRENLTKHLFPLLDFVFYLFILVLFPPLPSLAKHQIFKQQKKLSGNFVLN